MQAKCVNKWKSTANSKYRCPISHSVCAKIPLAQGRSENTVFFTEPSLKCSILVDETRDFLKSSLYFVLLFMAIRSLLFVPLLFYHMLCLFVCFLVLIHQTYMLVSSLIFRYFEACYRISKEKSFLNGIWHACKDKYG